MTGAEGFVRQLPWRDFFGQLLWHDPWVAGTGTDPRCSRSFNPVRQARRFDPDGGYVRRYVRKLADARAPRIFAPWRDPALLQSKGYPEPVFPVPDR